MQVHQRKLAPNVAYRCCREFVTEQVRKYNKAQNKEVSASTLFDFVESSILGKAKQLEFPYVEAFQINGKVPRQRPAQATWFIPGQKGSEITVLSVNGKAVKLIYGPAICAYCDRANTKQNLVWRDGKFVKELPECTECTVGSSYSETVKHFSSDSCECDACHTGPHYYHEEWNLL